MPKIPHGPAVLATSALLVAAPAAPAASSAPATTSPSVTLTATAITKALSSKRTKTTVTVANTGRAKLSGLTLRAAGAKGVQGTIAGAKRGVRALKPLKAGAKVRVSVTLRRTKGGPTSGAYGLRVRQKGKVVASGRIAFGPKATPVEDTVVGRYYWGSKYTLNGIQQYTLLFSSPGLVFTGDAEGTFPVCTAVTEDCRPYTYDPRTKALTIDGKPATITGTKLELDGQAYFALGTATAGARWDTVLTYSNSSGVCPLYCSSFTEYLTFRPDGTFIRSAVASGSGPAADYAVVPADQKGTYEVRADGTLRLAFADGKERVETLGVFPDKADAYPANPSAGIVLDGDGYFDIRD
ncbi:hypothetical protein [Patulibacter minatonensis]|uniref:hypothetical protein n=1 Tax=Patulibacter minatonensis TaxID=298163 RepID=UPI00047DE7ED|nr:hypothetical protein [Patulibacter minatonensis]